MSSHDCNSDEAAFHMRLLVLRLASSILDNRLNCAAYPQGMHFNRMLFHGEHQSL